MKQNDLSCYFETSAMWKRNTIIGDSDYLTGIENALEHLVHEIIESKDLNRESFAKSDMFKSFTAPSTSMSFYSPMTSHSNAPIRIDKRSLFCDS
jgi:hypothetical protein